MNCTELTDRVLWYDGESTFSANDVMSLLNAGIKSTDIHVDVTNSEIDQFNSVSRKDQQITVKTALHPIHCDWVLPNEYTTFDVYGRVIQQLVDYCERENIVNEQDITALVQRVDYEYALYTKHNKIDVLRTMFYIVDVLTSVNTIWGVGRGSSVSSFILYLIGVHDVDSFAYNLDIHDFLA